MKLSRNNLPNILIAVVAIVIIAFFVYNKSVNTVVVEINKPVPDFTLHDRAGKTVRLSDYRGKVVFLNFWASWCEPCKEEMPSMELLYRTIKDRGFEMIAVNVERMEKLNILLGKSNVKTFVDDLNLSFVVIHDGWGNVDRAYKLTGVPETYIIDQNGILVERIIGPRDWTAQQNIQTILDLLDKEPA